MTFVIKRNHYFEMFVRIYDGGYFASDFKATLLFSSVNYKRRTRSYHNTFSTIINWFSVNG